MNTLRKRLVKLAHGNPELRKDILPLLKEAQTAPNYDNVRRDLVQRIDDHVKNEKTNILEQAEASIESMEERAAKLQLDIENLTDIGNTLTILIQKGESRRLGKAAQGVQVQNTKYDGNKITAKTSSPGAGRGTYDTRITLAPRRGHHCTCMDWQQRGRSVGPCKHVLALGLYWQDEELKRSLSRVERDILNI